MTREIGIFDEDMNIKKMLFKKVIKFGSNRSRKEIEVFSPRIVTITDKKNIIIGNSGDKSSIKIYNHNGKLINTIKQKYPKVLITKEYKKHYIEHSISNAFNDIFRQMLKKNKHKFPKYFLQFSFLFSETKIIYVFRDIPDFSKYKVWAMTKSGKIKKKVIVKKGKCFWIKNGIYYYLLENIDDEEWELFSKKIL